MRWADHARIGLDQLGPGWGRLKSTLDTSPACLLYRCSLAISSARRGARSTQSASLQREADVGKGRKDKGLSTMYREHATAIAYAMRNDREAFERGVMFAMLSIRTQVITVPAQLDDVWMTRADSNYLLGFKRGGYAYLQTHAEALWRDALAIPLSDPLAAVRHFAVIPGLGIVKAAFVAQLMGWDVACIDSRNAQREGRSEKEFKVNKGTPAWERALRKYVAEVTGKAEHYWNAWCDYVAADYKLSGREISALHLAILPDEYVPF